MTLGGKSKGHSLRRGRRMLQRDRRGGSSAVIAVVTCVGCVGLLTVLGGLGHARGPGGYVLLGDREVQAGDAELAADSRDNVFSSRYAGGKLAATRAALPGIYGGMLHKVPRHRISHGLTDPVPAFVPSEPSRQELIDRAARARDRVVELERQLKAAKAARDAARRRGRTVHRSRRGSARLWRVLSGHHEGKQEKAALALASQGFPKAASAASSAHVAVPHAHARTRTSVHGGTEKPRDAMAHEAQQVSRENAAQKQAQARHRRGLGALDVVPESDSNVLGSLGGVQEMDAQIRDGGLSGTARAIDANALGPLFAVRAQAPAHAAARGAAMRRAGDLRHRHGRRARDVQHRTAGSGSVAGAGGAAQEALLQGVVGSAVSGPLAAEEAAAEAAETGGQVSEAQAHNGAVAISMADKLESQKEAEVDALQKQLTRLAPARKKRSRQPPSHAPVHEAVSSDAGIGAPAGYTATSPLGLMHRAADTALAVYSSLAHAGAPALATAVSAPAPSDANAAAATAAAAPSAGRGHPGVGARPATLRTGPLSLKRLLADFGAYKTAFSGFFHDQAHHASHRVKWAAPKV